MAIRETLQSPLKLLRGRITGLRKTRRGQEFFLTDADRKKIGATAIAAGLAGLGGIAVGLSGMAMDTTEEADLLEFSLDSKPVRAWVWQSVFEEGDEVEIVAEQWGAHWQGYGIRRLHDKIVALHPHCSRGRYAHYKAAVKLWLKICIPLLLFMYLLTGAIALFESTGNWTGIFQMWIAGGSGLMAILGVIGFRISKRYMGFVSLAEGVFEGFGWTNVKDIDLPKITRKGKAPGDPSALGVLYFRY
ncbi:hypothetical protein EN871_04250 [bacterium M00.F.Ca.ET.228.01.1.1]|uniref:putative type VI secretion system effector n=1 Tax=Paraburkholderia phenoliruptrix TaxID=252970 RepID=UPI001092CE80|nr:putative type VI secretion system effector [Paraburkholderia phenoliruptrix]TGP48019.1 hypothetical protein EN871_04250 [bacterium M00.F.Ca.ET.228.01.1.1]TGS05811.1 hypothetical protein EN834_04250 [bacterium M00.F.Ca.ET.191.01.1.1]TGU10748.1 hypothetical protein EN798_04250 [bacterium M00.F.Ca.ET.155.01.1.1]MBW0445162.1 hypothetical protein [Paraburkholderia phenoliruptrix]MBW9095927.1 hypothetical protein [Paraburkholderia phenoliruptrix]